MNFLHLIRTPRAFLLTLFSALIFCAVPGDATAQRVLTGPDTSSLRMIENDDDLAAELRFLTEKDSGSLVVRKRKMPVAHTAGIYNIEEISKYFVEESEEDIDFADNDSHISGVLSFDKELLDQITRQTGRSLSKAFYERYGVGKDVDRQHAFLLKNKEGLDKLKIVSPNAFGLEMEKHRFDDIFNIGKNSVYGSDAYKMFVDDPKSDKEADDIQSMKFRWKPAIYQSLLMLGIQHGYALALQEKTQNAVANGNFFVDYIRSLRKSLRRWDDDNRFSTNYIAHPMQGAMTGFIYLQNNPRSRTQKFAESKEYWNDRFKAFLWSTAWSTQFELGPISQSSIGNLGLYDKMGWVDLVITPTVGTVWLLAEDAIDRYILRHIEGNNRLFKFAGRTFLTPMRAAANLMRFKEPWYREREVGK